MSTVDTLTPCQQVHLKNIFEKSRQFNMVQRSLIFFAAINLILLYSATIANGKSLSRGKYLVDLSRYTQYGPIKNSRVKNQPSDFGKK